MTGREAKAALYAQFGRIDSSDALVIDVRPADKFAAGPAEGLPERLLAGRPVELGAA